LADITHDTAADGEPLLAPTTGVAIPGGGVPPQPTGPEREFTVRAKSQTELIVRRFLHHRLAVISLVVFMVFIVASLVGGRIWHFSYSQITNEFSTGPTLKHPFGTDDVGHDELAQVLRGSQKSVQIALLVALASTTIGTLVGAVAGYYRGWIDNVLMRFVDLILTVPVIAILAVLAATVSAQAGNWFLIAVILSVLLWTSIARVVRAVFLSLREKEFVEAARALGATDARIIFRHLLPNAIGPIIVNATLTVANAILIETALSYIGLGVKPPDTSLGLLVSNGVQAAQDRPWLFYFPGLFIILIALTVNFVGDGLRDAFDPGQTRVRA
jgi:peptide/nickel transport system permease protein